MISNGELKRKRLFRFESEILPFDVTGGDNGAPSVEGDVDGAATRAAEYLKSHETTS